MNSDEILAAIRATQTVRDLLPDTFAVAAALSVGRKKFVPTEVGNGTILEILGLQKGNTLIDLIASDSAFRHVRPLLEQGRLRLDSNLVRSTLQSLSPAVLTQAEVNALLAHAQEDDPVDEFAVRCAVFADDGTMKV